MREFAPLELIRANSWTSSLFTTYSLSLSYFEAVILDALVRQGVCENLILADIRGVRSALAEHGARYAGRSYQIEPVAVKQGCFHAKLTALTAPDDGHLIIGSGNLTVGGWGVNLECVEHLHPSFAADAFNDAADFLDGLATADNAKHGAVAACAKQAKELRRLAASGSQNGDIRLVSNLEHSIIDQLVDFADDLGGAECLTIVSPFFDSGVAVDRLCQALRLNEVSVHAHPSEPVAGSAGANWPKRTEVLLHAITAAPFENQRHLHAKAFEIICKRGRILMSGSANATLSALLPKKNVELSVVRIQRQTSANWILSPSAPLSMSGAVDIESAKETNVGILRAVLQCDEMRGEILTPFPEGDAVVSRITGIGPSDLATAKIAADGTFAILTRGLELEGWSAQRLIIRVRSTQNPPHVAEGFVAFPDIAEVTHRAGAIATKLLAVLAGTETPIDVAAVMSWFYEHPQFLLTHVNFGGRGVMERPEIGVNVNRLLYPPTSTFAGDAAAALETNGWTRFMTQVFSAFRTPRGRIALSSAPGDAIDDEEKVLSEHDAEAVDQATSAFDQLFDLLLGRNGGHRDLGLALQLSQYVCDRLGPSEVIVEGYLTHLLSAIASNQVPEADRPAFAAAVLVASAWKLRSSAASATYRNARRQLLRLGFLIDGPAPNMSAVRGFVRLLTPELDVSVLWTEIGAARTYQEEVGIYRRAAPGPLRDEDFPALASLPEWRRYSLSSQTVRNGVKFLQKHSDVCPIHHMVLPTSEKYALRNHGVARAGGGCCNTIIMCEEL